MIFDLAEFWDDLGVVQADFYLPDRRTMDSTSSGPIAPIQIGQRTWMGAVSIQRYPHADARAIDVKVEGMKEADGIFFLSPSDRQEGALTGTIATIATDRRLVTFSAGFTVAVGDYVGVNNGTTYSVHQVLRVLTGDFGAVTTDITVVPPIPLAIAPGDAATTDTPLAKARIGLEARGPGFSSVLSDTFSFDFQTILT